MNNLSFLFTKIAHAAAQPATPGVDALIGRIVNVIINPIIGLMASFAVIFFIIGVIEYIAGAANEEKRQKGHQHIIYGVLGLVVMFSVFGIMHMICGLIGISC